MTIRIGIDESGTGSLAGPFMVAAVVGPVNVDGLRDSKTITDRTRRKLVPEIKEMAAAWAVVGVPVEVIARDHRMGWILGIRRAAALVRDALTSEQHADTEVIVDGDPDKILALELEKLFPWVEFMEKADSKVPEVMAASILAKTYRNDAMLELSKTYPDFGWPKNSGYGTRDHKRAIAEHGLTPQHRPWRGRDAYSLAAQYSAVTTIPTSIYVAGSSFLTLPSPGDAREMPANAAEE